MRRRGSGLSEDDRAHLGLDPPENAGGEEEELEPAAPEQPSGEPEPQPGEQPAPGEQPPPAEEGEELAATAGEERPGWLPQNFRTPEDLARSYRELQGELSRRAENERVLEERMAQLEAYAQQQQSYGGDPYLEQVAEALAEARESGDYGRELALIQHVQQTQLDAALQRFGSQFQQQLQPAIEQSHHGLAATADLAMRERHGPEWDQLKAEVANVIAADPMLLPPEATADLGTTVGALERAYRIVRAERLLSQSAALEQRGITPEDSRLAKLGAQTVTQGGNGAPPAQSPEEAKVAALQAALRGSSYSAIMGRELP